MQKSIRLVMVLAGLYLTHCAPRENAEAQQSKTTEPQKTDPMKNLISIVEIPTADFPRAVSFYQSILNLHIEKIDMDGVPMGIFPTDENTVNVVLIHSGDYKPSADGARVYLNAGHDLQPVLDKVEPNGGKVVVPKTIISPEIGYFSLFIDTEGNLIGLHSMN